MRLTSVVFLVLCLAACHHGVQSNEAVRQGVVDHLNKGGLSVAPPDGPPGVGMDVTVTSVEYKGNTAIAAVSVTVHGQSGGMPMNFRYRLEQQGNKWVYVGLESDAGHRSQAPPAADPRGGGMPPAGAPSGPGAANPHGGGTKMPSPADLPPAKKK